MCFYSKEHQQQISAYVQAGCIKAANSIIQIINESFKQNNPVDMTVNHRVTSLCKK